jgi:hypothetical protein
VELPPAIRAKVRDAISDLDDSFDWGRLGRQHEAIPLLLTIGSMIFLRSDGTFLEHEGDPFPERLTRESSEINTIALAWGTERYPWLAELLPPRPPDARDCSVCAGARRLAVGESGHIYCASCAALGWVAG